MQGRLIIINTYDGRGAATAVLLLTSSAQPTKAGPLQKGQALHTTYSRLQLYTANKFQPDPRHLLGPKTLAQRLHHDFRPPTDAPRSPIPQHYRRRSSSPSLLLSIERHGISVQRIPWRQELAVHSHGTRPMVHLDEAAPRFVVLHVLFLRVSGLIDRPSC